MMQKKHSLSRRLFLFHALMMVGSLIILLLVSSGVAQGVSEYYQRQSLPSADSRTEEVQTLLRTWPTEEGDWEALDDELREWNYSLIVIDGDTEIYSSLDDFQRELYGEMEDTASWPEDGALAMQLPSTMLIGCTQGGYTIVAVQQPQMPELWGRERGQSEGLVLSLLISGAVVIAIVLLLSLWFTRRMMRRIMYPVNALTDAALRVGAGDFSTPVGYRGQDEFDSVCAAFDQMQQQLLQEREKNARYEKARTDLVSGISHDLRTPLTSVKGYIQGLRDGVANTPEKQRQYLSIAYRRACDMERLLQKLFYFSRMETGKVPLFLEHQDLGEVVRRFAEDAGAELSAAGGEIRVQCEDGAHGVRIDVEQILRVLTNLKDNAVRYAGAEPLILTLTVERRGDRECLRFADNGRGVPEEALAHLFEQFWRLDESRGRRGGQGSGLGLYIAKYTVEAHGGTITAKNENGLVFDITLPHDDEEAEA